MLAINVLDVKSISLEDVKLINSLPACSGDEGERVRYGSDLYIDRDENAYTRILPINDDWDLLLVGDCDFDVCRLSGRKSVSNYWLVDIYFEHYDNGRIHKPSVSGVEFEKISKWFKGE